MSKLPRLDLNQITSNPELSKSELSKSELSKSELSKSPKQYQKSLVDRVFEWDQLQVCVFCQISVNPLDRTRIIRKKNLISESESVVEAEYSCNKCAQKIASYTFVEVPPVVVQKTISTPRNISGRVISNQIQSPRNQSQHSPLSTHRKSMTDTSSEEESESESGSGSGT